MDNEKNRALELKRLEIIHTALELLRDDIERRPMGKAPAPVQVMPRRMAVNE